MEPTKAYKTPKRTQGIGKDFDFKKEFTKGQTIHEARVQIHRRLSKWKSYLSLFLYKMKY